MKAARLVRAAVLAALVGAIAFGFGGCLRMRYRFVDSVSRAEVPSPVESPASVAVRAALDPSTLRSDVGRLASPELEGRRRGSRGNALARAHLIGRLRAAGLAPLFGDAYEQGVRPRGDRGEPHATNVGAIWRSADPAAEWVVLVAHHDHLGIRRGRIHAGADDNAAAVAALLALADALGRSKPALPRHLALLFPDAEEPPDIRTERMGSSGFWRHPPLPIARLRAAVVLDLIGGRRESMEAAGLGDLLFVLGAEASPGLSSLLDSVSAEPGVEPLRLGLATIETYPFVPWRRFSVSDYHGLREFGRPFLFLSTGRTARYHTAEDTPETIDFERLAARARWIARLALAAAEGDGAIGWADGCADPLGDARSVQRLSAVVGDGSGYPGLLRRALFADRERVAAIRARLEGGATPRASDYRAIQLACVRLQAALWHPSGWWFGLW